MKSITRRAATIDGVAFEIISKDFRKIFMCVQNLEDGKTVFEDLSAVISGVGWQELPCFHYKPPEVDGGKRNLGWDCFPIEEQYRAMGLPNSQWKITDINRRFDLCQTYPRCLAVPLAADDRTLILSSRFRSKRRLPVLTYLHPNGSSTLCRCAQPMVGVARQCQEDINLFNMIFETNGSSQKRNLFVVDTRPYINALGNKAKGKGFENAADYTNIDFGFFAVDNIHRMRESFDILIPAVHSPFASIEEYAAEVDRSLWLKHIRIILETALFVANLLHGGTSVLIHCSDGWDRTSQVCSLAQLLLDPYYRTFEGFQALIQKDWILFGHKFLERSAIATPKSREASPIFVQFLDCVHHLMEAMPHKFQFSQNLLIFLHDKSQSAEYGTFLSVSEKHLLDNLADHTHSVWGYLRDKQAEFTNPFYEEIDLAAFYEDTSVPAWANGVKPTFLPLEGGRSRRDVDPILNDFLAPQNFHVWRSMYLRWEWRLPHRKRMQESILRDILSCTATLVSHNRLLRARIMQLSAVCERDVMLERLLALAKRVDSAFSSPVLVSIEESDAEANDGPRERDPKRRRSFIPFGQLLNLPPERQSEPDTATEPLEEFAPAPTPACSLSGQILNDCRQLEHEDVKSDHQLESERSFITRDWRTIVFPHNPCASCGLRLSLLLQQMHCHGCGEVMCERCLITMSSLLGMWPDPEPTNRKVEPDSALRVMKPKLCSKCRMRFDARAKPTGKAIEDAMCTVDIK